MLEEVGLPGLLFVATWLWIVLQRCARAGVGQLAVLFVILGLNMGEFTLPRRRRDRHSLSVAETICESIAHAAEDLPMGAIAVFTETGNTARMISKYRPQAAIYAFTHNSTGKS